MLILDSLLETFLFPQSYFPPSLSDISLFSEFWTLTVMNLDVGLYLLLWDIPMAFFNLKIQVFHSENLYWIIFVTISFLSCSLSPSGILFLDFWTSWVGSLLFLYFSFYFPFMSEFYFLGRFPQFYLPPLLLSFTT